ILILVLVCFNWWQDRRVRQRMQEHFPEADEDPLMGGLPPTVGRREPGIGAGAVTDAFTDEVTEADPVCEAVIDVVFSHPVSGAELQMAVRPIQKAGEKPVRVLVEHEGGHTLRLRDGNNYLSLQLAVLL